MLVLLAAVATGAWAQNHTVTLKDGTVDAGNWTIEPTEAAAGAQVTVTYAGPLKVKSVKAVKKAAPAAAEGHALSASAVGEIVGTNGLAYDVADKDNLPTGVTAAGVVAYKSGSNGLAIALDDEGSMNWPTAISTCEGKTPTVTGAKWCLPSQDQWKQMFAANGGNEGRYTGLNTTITNAGGTTLQANGYWSSSENISGVLAYRVALDNGYADWGPGPEPGSLQVRACLAFYVTPAATVTTAPTAKTGVKAGQNEAIVNAGTATGGTMMYKVTTANTKPTSTDGFSATVPTAEGLTAGTYYVWYYVKADDSHTDSEISATGIEVTIAAAVPATITVTINRSDWGEDTFTKDGVTVSADMIDPDDGNILGPGSFSTTLGKFTKIVVTAGDYGSGTGWSGGTWTGTPASTVSFNDDFYFVTTIVCTIVPKN